LADPYEALREQMVAEQLIGRGIKDPLVLAAMRAVPRHEFVPKRQRPHAYEDGALPIWYRATISQPLMVATMLEVLRISGGEKLLEIGTGSGYQAAVMREMGCSVTSVEVVPSLAEIARRNLQRLGYDVAVVVGDGSLGWPALAPYDRIAFTASPPDLPPSYASQLACGGRIAGPVGGREVQELISVDKTASGELIRHYHGGCVFLPLIGADGWTREAIRLDPGLSRRELPEG
jgi:protein-L-isoaspartate(D-aspartate) O-methyltransferase